MTPSVRRDGDTWDLASGVGATATAVATSRALATRAGIIDDRWAEPLVRAVGEGHFVGILDSDSEPPDQHRMTLGMALRTRFFDEFLLDAATAGIRQVVILASGLDARGYRLDWPTGTVVFDVDQPGVIEFKAATLAALGTTATADVRNVGTDLREDWPAALAAHGFAATARTAWIAEGLLMYLPADAQDRLFDHITALSPAGSRLATEFMPTMDAFTDADEDGESRWRRMGFSDDLAGLVYAGERSHVISYLEELGWSVSGNLVHELFEAYGLEQPADDSSEKFEGFQYICAQLG
jgi:methyltransferase (TIGR00027 family)